jgi:hypothetical protein
MQRGLFVVALVLSACAHKPPPAPPPPAPEPPKGELLRLKPKAGEALKSHVKLLIEQEVAGAQGDKRAATKPLVLQFGFGEEESVDSVAPDGSELVSARLVDAVGQASGGASQAMVDDMALAFDELKINFKRQARGEVVSIGISGLRKPLDEKTARQVLNALYGAQRGPLLPEERVEKGATWKVSMPMPGLSGYEGDVHYDYAWARSDGAVAIIGGEGHAEGKKGTSKLTSKSSAEYRFDVAAGKLLGTMVDQLTQVDDTAAPAGGQPVQSAVRQHVRVEWAVEAGEAREKQE